MDGVLDKKDGDVVVDNVKVFFVSVEVGSEFVDIVSGISIVVGISNGWELDEDGSFFFSFIEEGSSCDVVLVGIVGEGIVSIGIMSVNSFFGNLILMLVYYMFFNLDIWLKLNKFICLWLKCWIFCLKI